MTPTILLWQKQKHRVSISWFEIFSLFQIRTDKSPKGHQSILNYLNNVSKNEKTPIFSSELLANSDSEPVDDLNKGDKANPKTKSTEAAKARDEVQPGHLGQLRELWDVMLICLWDFGSGVTVHGWFSKEDVHNGDVLPKGIVVDWDLTRWKKEITKVSPDLSERRYQLPLSHRVRVLQPHRPRSLVDVGSCQIPVSLQDAWLPHCHRGWGEVAERAQVQISRVTGAEHNTKFLS